MKTLRDKVTKFISSGAQSAIDDTRSFLATYETGGPFQIEDPRSIDRIERVLASMLEVVRSTETWEKARGFKRCRLHVREEKLLDDTRRRLGLEGRWNDHLSGAETSAGRAIVAEPYGLGDSDFDELAKLRAEGWKVNIADDCASYFVGSAVCLVLRPPKKR